jgi:hypothetical protein
MYNSLPSGQRKYLARHGILSAKAAHQWAAATGQTVVQATLKILQDIGLATLAATGKWFGGLKGWVGEHHRHRRKYKDRRPQEFKKRNGSFWTNSKHEHYLATSNYAPLIRRPDPLKGENAEVRIKCRRCGTERLDKNPDHSRNLKSISPKFRDVFLVKNLICSRCKKASYLFDPVDKSIPSISKEKFRQTHREVVAGSQT